MLHPKEMLASLSPSRSKAADGLGLKEKEQRFLDAIKTLTFRQYSLFIIGWMAWTCDAMDFFSVSLLSLL
jgi:hypothetical protein